MALINSIEKKEIPKSIIAGIFLGILLTIDGGIVFIGFIFFLAVFMLQKYFSDIQERDYVVTIFILGFLLRALLCAGIHAYNKAGGNLFDYMGYTGNCFLGDSAFTSVKSQFLADIWRRKASDPVLFWYSMKSPSGSLHYYVYSVFYYFFGNHELSSKFINILYGTISGIFVYLITKELFNKRVAKLSYALTMFFPSLILWSVTNLKETALMLIFSIWIYSLTMIRKEGNKIGYFLMSTAALLSAYTIKRELMLLLFLGGIVGFFLSLKITTKKTIIAITLLALTISLLYCYLYDIDIVFMLKLKAANFMKSVITWQSSLYKLSGHNYKIYPDKFYAYDIRCHISAYFFSCFQIVYFVLKAIVLFLTVPLPWMTVSLMQAACFPQLFLWYSIIIFSIPGFMQTIYKKNTVSFLIPGFLITLIIPMALVSANMGSTFRHRDLFTPFFIIYASYGLYRLLEKYRLIRFEDGD